MHSSFSHHRIVRVAALALLGLAWTALAAEAADTVKFKASATFQIDSQFRATHGTQFSLTAEGSASPGGSFDATAYGGGNWGNYYEWAVLTLDFGKGDTLTLYIEDYLTSWDPYYERTGSYVVTDGTGKFVAASGSGTFTGNPAGDGTGVFYLDGTLAW